MSTGKKWYVVYTKPRWEKKVYRLLTEREIDAYCPLNKVEKKWSDRIKLVEEPLFKSYVFVNMDEETMSRVRLVEGVLNFVYWNGKPAVVKDREINDIRRFLNEYREVHALPLQLEPGAKAIIRGGVMMDKEATVQRIFNNKVEVLVESLGYQLVAYIDKKNLAPFKN